MDSSKILLLTNTYGVQLMNVRDFEIQRISDGDDIDKFVLTINFIDGASKIVLSQFPAGEEPLDLIQLMQRLAGLPMTSHQPSPEAPLEGEIIPPEPVNKRSVRRGGVARARL